MAFQFTGFHHSGSGPWNKSLPFIIQCLFSHISNLDLVWFISVFASFLLLLLAFSVSTLRNTRSSGSWIFFFSSTLSHTVSASLYSAVKLPSHLHAVAIVTTYPPSLRTWACDRVCTLGMCVSKSACALRDVTYWKSVRWLLVSPPWGFSLIRGCLRYTKLHTHTQPHTSSHTSTHSHSRGFLCA